MYTRAEECTRALNVLTDLDNGVTILNQLGGNFNLKLFKVSIWLFKTLIYINY